MKKLLTLILLLFSCTVFGQTTTLEVKENMPPGFYDVVLRGTVPPDPGNCANCLGINPIVVDPVTGVMTITYSNGTVYVSPPLKGPKGDKGDKGDPGQSIVGPQGPQGIQGIQGPAGTCPICPPSSGTGGVNYNALNNYYNIKEYGAVGNGTTDDRAAIQAAINITLLRKGKLIIPAPSNYYRINSTLRFEPTSPENQAFFDVEGQGHWERQIVYQGPSGSAGAKVAAVVIDGMKGGSFTRFMVKIGDGVNYAVAIDIGTRIGGSTAGFSFNDCTTTLNRGTGNEGWRLGEIPSSIGEDIAQLSFINCKAEGWPGPQGPLSQWPGQIGFNITGRNTLALTWAGGSAIFVETAVKLEQGGSLFFKGFQTSHVGNVYWMQWANILNIDGHRSEHDKKFLFVANTDGSPMAAHPIVTISGAMIEDAVPTDGKVIDFRGAGTLILNGISINKTDKGGNYGSGVITLTAPANHPFGSFHMTGGRLTAPDPFIASSGWRVNVKDVVKLQPTDPNYLTSVGYFTNKP